MRFTELTKDQMAAVPAVELVSKLLESLESLPSGYNRKACHSVTSMVSSTMDGGIGSPWALRLAT